MAQNKSRLVTIVRNGGSPLRAVKIQPNSFCKCGSGKKSKKCCGTETTYFYTGKALQNKIEVQNKNVQTIENV